MAVIARNVEQVPERNLRVTPAEFQTVWEHADRLCHDPDVSDWYAAAVVTTCMWVAGATYTPPWGRSHPARSPATDRDLRAYPETIEAELVAAELLARQRPQLAELRPGWTEGIAATLRWAWRAEERPNLRPHGSPTSRDT